MSIDFETSYRMTIGGKLVGAEDTFGVINPATEEIIAEAPEASSFSPHVALGGHRQSGIGIENALEGLSEYTNSQTIYTNSRQI